jgi:hypothetical protein
MAFTTTRDRGDFNLLGDNPRDAFNNWFALQQDLAVPRLVFGAQVHGTSVAVHNDGWAGWLRVPATDGHIALDRGTALAVTLADCVPVFLASPGGPVALLHAGWRGAAAGIIGRAAATLASLGHRLADFHAHLGPAICARCYEVGPEVVLAVEGRVVAQREPIDLRAALGRQLAQLGVPHVTVSQYCTRCHNERFYSHRAGNAQRHIAVIARIA